jgi:hypothetical protein
MLTLKQKIQIRMAYDIAKREDVNPKEGKKKYGDVEYMDSVNNKYPLDKEHIVAAARYWGVVENRAKYSKKDQATMTAKLERAKKKFNVGHDE